MGRPTSTIVRAVVPKLSEVVETTIYGDIWERPELSKRDRSMITLAALIAMRQTEVLRSHMERALGNGVTQQEISEIITHLAFYAGFPAALSSALVAQPLWEERGFLTRALKTIDESSAVGWKSSLSKDLIWRGRMSEDLYLTLAAATPTAVELGGALITMPHAHAGREEAFNRWYEDDHYISGAMVGPWVFSGRRFVRCDLERFAAPGATPTEMGSFIGVYWALAGHVDEVWRWAKAALEHLTEEGRGPRDRTRVYSAMHELAFGHVFDPAPMKVIHALDYPYRGLAVELADAANAASREALVQWLRDEYVPSQAGPIGQCIALVPRGLRDERREPSTQGPDAGVVPPAIDPNPERRVCLLWFLRDDPHEFWPGAFAEHAHDIEARGLGRLVLLAPFVPTLPGTVTPLAGANANKETP